MVPWTDPWIIGIGGSTASGLIVWFLTSFLFTKKDQAQYRQDVASANEHVLNALRNTISEETIPSSEVIAALRAANARKFAVRIEDVWAVDQVFDELVREVMDSSFLSIRTKESYSNRLILTKQAYFEWKDQQSQLERDSSVAPSKNNSGWSGLFALVAMSATAVFAFQLSGSRTWVVALAAVLVPAVLVVLAAIVFVLVSNLGKKTGTEESVQAPEAEN